MGTEVKDLRCGTCDHLEFDWDEVCYCDKSRIFVDKEQPGCISHSRLNERRPIGFVPYYVQQSKTKKQ